MKSSAPDANGPQAAEVSRGKTGTYLQVACGEADKELHNGLSTTIVHKRFQSFGRPDNNLDTTLDHV
jgi:hypothetical protein